MILSSTSERNSESFLLRKELTSFKHKVSFRISGKFSSRKDLTSLKHKVSILSWNKGRRPWATFKGKQRKGKTPHNVILTFKEFCSFIFFTNFKACKYCLVNSRWNDIDEMDKTLAKYFVVVVSYARKYFCFSQIQHEDKTNAKTKKEREKWSLTLLQDVGDSLAMWVYLVLKYSDSSFLHLH